jgi:hypothetical protein
LLSPGQLPDVISKEAVMSSRRARIVVALCLLPTFTTAGGVAAQGPGPGLCYVHLFGPSEVTLNRSECSSIVLGTVEWCALAPGLVNAFIKDLEVSVSATGPGLKLAMDPAEFEEFWSPIFEASSDISYVTCPHRDNLWASIWMRDLGTLPPSSYSIHSELVLRHPVTDALQQCSYLDGTPVGHYVYSDWYWVTDISLTVLDQ